MKILLAPDSYKECLSSAQVAAAMASGIRAVLPSCEILSCPLADGGEGTVEVLVRALGGSLLSKDVTGPLGTPVQAVWGKAGETAFIEVAAACGLQLVPPERRNPLLTGTRGVGELLLEALEQGCRRIYVGLGGSATCDGGAGMMEVPSLAEKAKRADIRVLCDVDTPFVGENGAARVFGPQKGASPEQVEELEDRMVARARQILRETGIDVADLPGAGAAGGLGGALHACLGARLVPGIQGIMELCGFDRLLEGVSLVITGEGSSDRQTPAGKGPFGVLRRCGDIPVALVSGAVVDRDILKEAGFRDMIQATPAGMPLEEALRPAGAINNIRQGVIRLLTGRQDA